MAFPHTNRWNRFRYSAYSPVYDLVLRRFSRSIRRRSLEMATIRPDDQVLLVGAGTGLDLELLPSDPRIVATDLTPAMLGKLTKRAKQLGMPNVSATVSDGQQLAFADNTFDLVILHFIVAVIPDPLRCIAEAARVVRQGGHVLIMDKFAPDEGPAPIWLRAINPLMSVLVTDVTRRLGPLVTATNLQIRRQQPLALKGIFKAALLRKSL